jgi:hypothetical protein
MDVRQLIEKLAEDPGTAEELRKELLLVCKHKALLESLLNIIGPTAETPAAQTPAAAPRQRKPYTRRRQPAPAGQATPAAPTAATAPAAGPAPSTNGIDRMAVLRLLAGRASGMRVSDLCEHFRVSSATMDDALASIWFEKRGAWRAASAAGRQALAAAGQTAAPIESRQKAG